MVASLPWWLRSANVSLAAQLELVAYRMQRTSSLHTALITLGNAALSTPLSGHTDTVKAVAFSFGLGSHRGAVRTGGRDRINTARQGRAGPAESMPICHSCGGGHAAPRTDVQVARAGAQHSDRTVLQFDPVDAEDGHCGDFIRNHVEDDAPLAECGGVATRALVRVTDGVGVVFQVFALASKAVRKERGSWLSCSSA